MRIPLSLVFFLLTVCGYAMQIPPEIGFYLMMLAAPLWSVLLVNLGFLGIGLEVWVGRVSRLWLVLPILWFGGYTGLSVRDHLALAAIRSEMAAANEGAAVPFDPAAMSLVVVGGQSSLDNIGAWLVQNYHIPVVYERLPASAGGQTRAYRLASREECQRVREANLGAAGITVMGFHDYGGGRARFVSDFCTLQMPEAPPHPTVEITSSEISAIERGLDVTRQRIAIRMPNGPSRELVSGAATLLPWFPRPVIGCWLGQSRWQCGALFRRSGFVPLAPRRAGGRSAGLLIVDALGLRPMSPAERIATPAPQTRARFASAEAAVLAADVAELETVLRDPLARIDSVPFRLLRRRPGVLAPYADRIAGALERAAALGPPARENGRNLASLAAALPAPAFAPLSDRILALYRRHGDGHWLRETGGLIARSGDFGVAALPILMDGLEPNPGWLSRPAVEGICRIGSAAASVAGPRLLAHWRRNQDKRLDDGGRAVYAALLRLGLRDEVGPVEGRDRRGWFRDAWRSITPASSPAVCAMD
jgi:hypothetical protein